MTATLACGLAQIQVDNRCESARVFSSAFHLSLPVFLPGLRAATLQSATVTQTHNQVQLSKDGREAQPAAVRDVVAGKDVLRTGKKSRAEVLFNDNTIARLGSSSIFSFAPGTDQMNIDRGSALIHVPPGQSGAKIKSPAATVAVLGDVVAMRVDERGVTQVVALSEDPRGPVTVTFNKTGEKTELKAGEMLVIDPVNVRMPEISVINVEVFAQSSGLVNGFEKKLSDSAQKEIDHAKEIQEQEIKSGELEGGEGELKADTDPGLKQDNTITEVSNSTRFAGHYTGKSIDRPPCSPIADQLIIDVAPDGSFTGTFIDGSTGFVDSFSGSVSGNNFTSVSSDDTIQGTFNFGSGTITGTARDSSCISDFSVSR